MIHNDEVRVEIQNSNLSHTIGFRRDFTYVSAEDLANVIWKKDKRMVNSVANKAHTDSRKKDNDLLIVPCRTGAYLPISNAKEWMKKWCIKRDAKAKEMEELFDYARLSTVAEKAKRGYFTKRIRLLDMQYRQKRRKMTEEYRQVVGESFIEDDPPV